jgi:hypothetical protein
MELIEPLVSWRPGRYLNAARDRVTAMLARTRWLGSPQCLPPSQIVSPMSDEWMQECERHCSAHDRDGTFGR